MSACLSEEQLQAAIEGSLAEDTPEHVHLRDCPTCRAVLALARTGTLGSLTADVAQEVAAPVGARRELARGETVGRYLIVDRIGAGGMGVVHSAYDTELDRRIAIKLLHPTGPEQGRGSLRERMLREAQAMAKLAHPNIVRVYDVGEHEGSLFIAMELVEGATLAQWLRAASRTWREVLAAFRAAGAGLAAAHEAGIVHRDFKPANVLVGNDGGVFVTDFGLAHLFEAPDAEEPSAAKSIPAPHAGRSLTQRGAIVGTPNYMAPEVFLGEAASVQSDVFSFCVALYEGLYGVLPFERRSLGELRQALLRGAPEPAGANVPRWVRREIVRGLDADPSARHPSMRALNDALARDPTVRWKRAGAITLVASLVATGIGWRWAAEQREQERCMAAGSEADAVWNDEANARIAAAFLKTKVPSAKNAVERVSRSLDTWKATYVSMERDRCLATQHRTQPETLLARRTACLARQRLEATALVALFAEADAKLVLGAGAAADHLDGIESCGDLAALSASVPLPAEGQQQEVAAIRAELAGAVVSGVAGKSGSGIKTATTALARAQATGYVPLIAEIQLEVGRLQVRLGAWKDADESLRQATWNALSVQDDALAARSFLELAYLNGNQQAIFEEARRALRFAEAMLTRVGGDLSLEASVHNGRGQVAYKQGHFAEAVGEYRRALDLRRRAGSGRWLKTEGDVTAAENAIRNNLANALAATGAFEEAQAEHQAVLENRLKSEGPLHPSVAGTYSNMGFVFMEQFRYREARERFERSLEVREQVLPPGDRLLGMSHANLGMALAGLGDHDRAIEHLERSLAIYTKATGGAHPDVAAIITEIADARLTRGELDAAESALERAFAVLAKTVGVDHAQAARTHQVNGALLMKRGRAAKALLEYEQAVAITEKAKPNTPSMVAPLVGVGAAHLALGAPARAIEPLRRALALGPNGDPTQDADAAFTLARALPQGDPEIATLLARARERYQKAGEVGAPRLQALETWAAGRRQ